MELKRNKQIAISVLKGMTYDNVGILHDISRERVYQITKRLLERVYPEIVNQYNIKTFRLDRNRLIGLISEL
jgi:DNA-directed RNA polymerase sigma subunit (sigma70/sigma32)